MLYKLKMPEQHFMYEYLQSLIRSHWKICQKSCLKIIQNVSVSPLGKKGDFHFWSELSLYDIYFLSPLNHRNTKQEGLLKSVFPSEDVNNRLLWTGVHQVRYLTCSVQAMEVIDR